MGVDTVKDYCDMLKSEIHLTNVSVTALSSVTKDFWKSTRGMVIRIEILVVLAALMFLVLGTFGRYRRRSRNCFIQKSVFGAFSLSSSLVTYTIGSMQSSPVKGSMYSLWAIALFLLHGCTDSITAHSLSDNTQITKQWYQVVLYYLYGLFLLISGMNETEPRAWENPLVIILLGLSLYQFMHRLAAYHLATRSWKLNKIVADYMHEEHEMGGEIDPVTMEGCHYLVDWPLGKSKMNNETYATKITADSNEIIDIKKIWLCESLDTELKYECLSFSLFHLLRRRVFGFACGESKEKAHDFVFKGLLLDPEDGYIRVFKVIEAELTFMYDFYFTKYAAIYYRSMAATIWYLVSATSICLTIYAVATRVMDYDCFETDMDLLSLTIINSKADVIITLVILASAALLELVQILVFWTSVWGRVSFACQHVREEAAEKRSNRGRLSGCCMMIMMTVKSLLANIGMRCDSNKHYWQHELGQYSLIGAVSKSIDSSNPSATNQEDPQLSIMARILTSAVGRTVYLLDYLALSVRSRQAIKIRGEQCKPIKLHEQVKKAVVLSLVRSEGELTNGKSSLVVTKEESLSWACEWDVHPETTCIILTWHIATCYCEMVPYSGGGGGEEAEIRKLQFDVATTLSKYCAYLVVSEPKLLHGHHYDTAMVFDAAAEESIKTLRSATNMYEAMKTLPVAQATVFERGVKLGKELESKPESKRWKVLAEFWAEMLLYAAPSDNVNEHIDRLTKGGEFITHLWALLSHAGILGRKPKHQAGIV
ncbi:hypothetical protein CFC21_021328 [Triticum aestivum]|uniref:DUF4220 domain-containing protein n=3 Tax=Triticum TaxID=4564 RepID=A0A9R1PDC6_TRITD|nr:uncharacterized protein LOC123040356 [Triticum aestivum]KAF7006275.1 hypothetical protein CFC21_021328 [Triticum aestivum]VAH41321.1 unnamed protein product [Triticum turgidum subsp. durum]